MSGTTLSLVRAARRVHEALQKETMLARMGSVRDLAQAAADKAAAMTDFAAACAARDPGAQPTSAEREALRRVLAAADENALILEAVGVTLKDLLHKVRTAVTTALDPGTYSLVGRNRRHVRAACVDASV